MGYLGVAGEWLSWSVSGGRGAWMGVGARRGGGEVVSALGQGGDLGVRAARGARGVHQLLTLCRVAASCCAVGICWGTGWVCVKVGRAAEDLVMEQRRGDTLLAGRCGPPGDLPGTRQESGRVGARSSQVTGCCLYVGLHCLGQGCAATARGPAAAELLCD